MVAVDTNVLIRLLVSDDDTQGRASRRLFASEQVYIPDTVLLEAAWVLRAAFDLKPKDICAALRHVCGLPNVRVSDGPLIARVIDWHEAGLDFADAFHLALSKEQPSMKTFDAAFIKAAKRTGRHVERP